MTREIITTRVAGTYLRVYQNSRKIETCHDGLGEDYRVCLWREIARQVRGVKLWRAIKVSRHGAKWKVKGRCCLAAIWRGVKLLSKVGVFAQ